MKDISTIILALDWRAYLFGKHYITFADSRDESAEAFADALNATLDYWEKLGKRVVIFYSPPQGMNLDACIPRRWSLTDPESCRYTRRQAEERDAGYRAKLSEIIGRRANIQYFDPFPFLCSDATCMVTHGAHSFYRDAIHSNTTPPFIWNHLSLYGAEYLARASEEELAKLLGLQR